MYKKFFSGRLYQHNILVIMCDCLYYMATDISECSVVGHWQVDGSRRVKGQTWGTSVE